MLQYTHSIRKFALPKPSILPARGSAVCMQELQNLLAALSVNHEQRQHVAKELRVESEYSVTSATWNLVLLTLP